MTNPSSSYRDCDKFKAVLKARIAELEHALGCRDFIAVEQTADQLDEVQQASELTLVICNLDRGSQELRDARAALRRMADGSFGVCQECGEEIHSRRLLAIPWASLCIHCQEEADRNHDSVHDFTSNFIGSLGLSARESA